MAEVDYVFLYSINQLLITSNPHKHSTVMILSLSLQTRLTNDTKRDFSVKLWSTCSSGIIDLHDTGLIAICRYV